MTTNWRILPSERMMELKDHKLLVRESNPFTENVTYIAGTLLQDFDKCMVIRDANGQDWPLSELYNYHYVEINEILF